jgi:hypothetical protein
MKYLFISAFTIFFLGSFAQRKDYTYYFDQIVQIEECTSNENFEQSLVLYESLFAKYETVFARDAFNACQIAALQKSKTFDLFFYINARSGVGKKTLLSNSIIAGQYNASPDRFDTLFRKGSTAYFSGIDMELRNEFRRRFREEQESKGKPEYKSICYDNFDRILQLSKQNRFPSESVIGVNDDLENGFVFATLKHYPYAYTILKDYLWATVRAGGTQPLAVLYVYGFSQSRVSGLYKQIIFDDSLQYVTCYNLPFGKASAHIEEVDKARKDRQILSVETMHKLELVSRKYHFDYRYGF